VTSGSSVGVRLHGFGSSLSDPPSRPEAGIPAHSSIAIDGELAGYDSYGCLVVQDFATGLKRVIPLPATLDPVVKGVLCSRAGSAAARAASEVR